MYDPTPEDIATARKEGDLAALLLMAAGIAPKAPKQQQAEPEKPCYHIRRPGAWPCGTAATGPTPAPCSECQEAAA